MAKIFSMKIIIRIQIWMRRNLFITGINWLENVNRYGENITKRLYKSKRHSFLPIKFFEELISKNNFKLVVTTNFQIRKSRFDCC